jgi:hypothetical protein
MFPIVQIASAWHHKDTIKFYDNVIVSSESRRIRILFIAEDRFLRRVYNLP